MNFSADQISELLKKHSLRKTSVRLDVLKLFNSRPYALSHSDLEENLGNTYDRVTIYRTLNSFEEKGLIHKVPDDSDAQKYALCQEECSLHNHNDEHIHFLCSECGNTFCLENVKIPDIKLPKGYKATQLSFTVNGTCDKCNSKG